MKKGDPTTIMIDPSALDIYHGSWYGAHLFTLLFGVLTYLKIIDTTRKELDKRIY